MNTEKIAKYATTQSVSEVGVGSFLHAFHIPFSGQFLSLNQGFLMTLALRNQASRRDLVGIAFSAALLKSLSPAGKKLMPMLAISVQGLLYASGVLALGTNIFGAFLGMFLLSLWAYAQPLLMAWLFFGNTFFLSVQTLWTEIAQRLGIVTEVGVWILVAAVAVKIVAGLFLVFVTWRSTESVEAKYMHWIEKWKAKIPLPLQSQDRSFKGAFVGALKDLLNPLFLVSLALSVGFVSLGHSSEIYVWRYIARVVLAGWIFFFVVRILPVERLVAKLK